MNLNDTQTEVSLTECPDYSRVNIEQALQNLLEPLGGLEWVKPGMKIAIKANLVSCMKPEDCATTHPALLCALVKMIKSKGASAVIGDSPGGLYTSQYVNRIYEGTGMRLAEKDGAVLNQNFEVKNAEFLEAKVLKSFTYTSWLDDCDAIINFCKLKTHGMMGMSAAAKNMFGVIPGIMKPEYHYRFPNLSDFSDMIIDLNEYFKPALCIVDAVFGMEGNGPTKGSPRHVGLLLASRSPHKLDLVCGDIIGLSKENVPTLTAAFRRGLIPEDAEKVKVSKSYSGYKIKDYNNIAVKSSMLFDNNSKLRKAFLTGVLSSRPKLKKSECVGCGKCKNMCPAKAITINGKKKAEIDRSLCIRCFCCQEFCPVGAMKVYRTPVARILSKN